MIIKNWNFIDKGLTDSDQQPEDKKKLLSKSGNAMKGINFNLRYAKKQVQKYFEVRY